VDREREPLPTRVQDTPELPAAYDEAVTLGLAALGVDLSPDARAAIDGHVRLLLAWTRAINLTAIREPAAVATAHVVDSLSAVPWLRRRAPGRLLDLGSGGGFPGLPLAAALADVEVTLAEPIGKKARFLTTAVEASGLPGAARRVTVATTRAETIAADRRMRGGWSIVTARAVASTADLVELAFPLLARGGTLVAWKRGDLRAELEAAGRAMAALGGGRLDVLPVDVAGLAGHRLVIAERTGNVPDRYPRDPAGRTREPW
jgi:16S rRNA (guanine527-N7)-methyltransferase